ncbi:HNH endonuclease signature motif containing protein [Rhodococcus jostii]|uniref:DUF222 domain-containing protein n=1 Tax=Rhodococcus jostii TaxID=132919 RepID=A0A1H4YNP4_RHOJO|nr:HNH endonuclease signature motif containing protein [Rhodococcus jostii]SED18750.1 protein of unknown function [Rhodococcus jostii]
MAVTDFYDLCSGEDERRGINPAHSGRHASVELSVALGMNETTATAWIELGLELRHRLHRAHDAFAAGHIDLDQTRVIATMLTGVDDAELYILEAAILDGRPLPPSKLRARWRRLVARHDPDSLPHRAKLAAADRDVRVRPADNGMSHLDGNLPAADAHTIAMRLRDIAIHDVCSKDPRTLAERRADALTALADGTGALVCRCGNEHCHTRTGRPTARRAPLIQVVINAGTLLGLDDTPAHLDGYGPIDADAARALAADGVFQRVYTHAAENGGSILGISAVPNRPGIPTAWIAENADRAATTYTPGIALARRIRARDGLCRFPNCQVPARNCDLDHIIPFDHDRPESGGLTVEPNLACLCRRHHRLETDGTWSYRHTGAGHLESITPRGKTVPTEPEGAALALTHTTKRIRGIELVTQRSHAEHDLDFLIELHRRPRSRKKTPQPDMRHSPEEPPPF